MSTNETGKAIQLLREAKGLTQESLAEKIGVSQQSVAKWESGQSLPRSKAVSELERELDAPKGYLADMRIREKVISDSNTSLSAGETAGLPKHEYTDIFKEAGEATYATFEPLGKAVRPSEYSRHIRQSIAKLVVEESAQWETTITGGTIAWSVDYSDSHHVAQFLAIGSGEAQRMAYFTTIPRKLWQLATLRAHLRDKRIYMLLITVPTEQGFERTRVYDLFRKFIAEAALMEIFVFVVNTPAQAAALLSSKFHHGLHEDGDDVEDDLFQ